MNGEVSHPVPISTFKEACTSFVWNTTEKLLMIYSFHSTTIAIYLGTHPRAKPYQPSLTTQDHSQETTCRIPRISYQRLVLQTLVGLSLRTGRMWPWDAPKVRLHWAVDGCDGQGVLSRDCLIYTSGPYPLPQPIWLKKDWYTPCWGLLQGTTRNV